jgi:hypothetical protein
MEIPFIADGPIELHLDHETGLLLLSVPAGMRLPNGAESQMRLQLLLPPATGQALLADLPTLQTLLERQAAGPSRPASIQ